VEPSHVLVEAEARTIRPTPDMARLTGNKAAEGTRTLDLLHGKQTL
jgi:hypothetical protein